MNSNHGIYTQEQLKKLRNAKKMFNYHISKNNKTQVKTINEKINQLMIQSEWLNNFLIAKDIKYNPKNAETEGTKPQCLSDEELSTT